MKKIVHLLLLVAFLMGCNANSPEQQRQQNGNLFYILNNVSHTATVTYETRDSTNYSRLSGDLDVPNTITIDTSSYIVVGVADYAFNGCLGLKSIDFAQSVVNIGYGACNNCTNLESVFISDSATHIGGRAFYNCKRLQKFMIPQNVTTIEMWTFGYCKSLKVVEIHENVSRIDHDAFTRCDSLQVVINYAKDPQEYDNIFFEVDLSKVTLKVPEESVDAYKNAKGWKHFGSIIAL